MLYEVITIKFLYFLFRNVTGQMTVNVLLEDRNGSVSTVKTFTITGSAIAGNTGWGIDTYGTQQWGESGGEVVVATDVITSYSIHYTKLYDELVG